MNPPTPPLDIPAVEAVKQFVKHHWFEDSEGNFGTAARIITDAYAEQRDDEITQLWAMVRGESPLPDKDHIVASRLEIQYQLNRTHNLNARLTSERQVREKLVEALQHVDRHFISVDVDTCEVPISAISNVKAALALAKKLEDADDQQT